MTRLTYETRRNGLDVWLATDTCHLTVEVRRAGTLLAKSEVQHYGSVGPDSRLSPQTSEFANFYIDRTICKAVGIHHRSAFDRLVDELAREMAGRGGQRILLFKAKPARRRGRFSAPTSRRSAKSR